MEEKAKARLKDEVVAARRYWHPFHDVLLEHDPDFLAAYLEFQHGPWRSGALEPKVRELVYVAVDLSCAHLYERGARRHMEFALEAGASPAEILQVVKLAAALGAWTARQGLGILAEELAQSGATGEGADRGAALRERLEPLLGEWPKEADTLVRVAPGYAEAALRFIATARQGPLAGKIVELVGLAMSASPATLHEPGMRYHIRRALSEGATAAEIADVLQLAGGIAIHSCTIGLPQLAALIEEPKG